MATQPQADEPNVLLQECQLRDYFLINLFIFNENLLLLLVLQ